jgi:hypothetical protein
MLVDGSLHYRTQPRASQIHDVVPIHCKFNLIRSVTRPWPRRGNARTLLR